MREDQASGQRELILSISEVLESHGQLALGEAAPEDVAQEWIVAGFEDAEEVDEWLRARCFRATDAQALEMAGITPAQASMRTTAGTANYEDTIGYKLSHNDLSINEARRIITSAFWNS